MYQPFLNDKGDGRTLWGLRGLGSFGFTKVERNDGKFVVATTRSHSDKVVEEGLEKIKADEVLRVGGAGYKAMLVLEGSEFLLIENFRKSRLLFLSNERN